MDLAGKTALVTGGAKRVGKAIVLALAEAGCDLVLHYNTSSSEAEATAEEVRALGATVDLIQADLGVDPARAVIGGADSGPIHILINSAAMFPSDTLTTLAPDTFDQTIDVNLRAPIMLTAAFARALPDDQDGAVVNLTDWRTARPYGDHFSYTIAKGGIDTFTIAAAEALAPRIRVNAVALGAILPPPGKSSQYLKDLAKDIPLKRVGGTDPVADAVLFLLRNDFVTGEIVQIDGGAHLR
ncbi:MAG TPA: SDR family oxidoreductase [Acidimicrobiia bacterium]|nr:SDR family oxidoreductase [Acidimicrobiia bacterium]